MDYLYDGSFEGLLTAVYYCYYVEKADGIYPLDSYQYSFLTRTMIVSTDTSLAGKVYDAAEKKISPEFLRQVYYVFLSNSSLKENLILKYIQLGFKLGPKINGYHTHPDILPVQVIANKVAFEAHRFLGLLRFADCGQYLYAVFEPDHNILVLLADHFADRLAKENFIIHDKKRNLAIVYNRQEWFLTVIDNIDDHLAFSSNEIYYQELWARYFTQIGISSRKNKKLQAHFVPQRYRHNLIEFIKTF